MARATEKELRGAVHRYAVTLAAYGLMPADVARTVGVHSPYGPVMYVCRYADGATVPEHDVPGFDGSAGAGFVTVREGLDRVRQSTRTLHEIARAAGWRWDDVTADTVTAAGVAV